MTVTANMETKTVQVSTLIEDSENARSHPERNMRAIVESLRRFGQVEPLVVQKASGVVIGGNGRLLAMRELGWDSATVVEVDLDDVEATALGLVLNRTADLAEWDYGQLSQLIEQVTKIDDLDLDKLGWQPFEVEQLLAAEWNPPDVDPDYKSPTPTSKAEDVGVTIQLTGACAELFARIAGDDDPAETVDMLCQFYMEGRSDEGSSDS